MKFLQTILIFLFCSCGSGDSTEKIFTAIFKEETNSRPEILQRKRIDLNSNPGKEEILIIRNIQEEILAIISYEKEEPKLEYQFRFTTPNYGPFHYSWKSKRWEQAQYSLEKESYLIQNIEFFKLPGDDFFSIFIEILSEEPPLSLFSVPRIYRQGRLVFDGLETLKNEKFLSENLKTSFQFDERNGKLNIISPSGKVERVYYYEDGKFIKR